MKAADIKAGQVLAYERGRDLRHPSAVLVLRGESYTIPYAARRYGDKPYTGPRLVAGKGSGDNTGVPVIHLDTTYPGMDYEVPDLTKEQVAQALHDGQVTLPDGTIKKVNLLTGRTLHGEMETAKAQVLATRKAAVEYADNDRRARAEGQARQAAAINALRTLVPGALAEPTAPLYPGDKPYDRYLDRYGYGAKVEFSIKEVEAIVAALQAAQQVQDHLTDPTYA